MFLRSKATYPGMYAKFSSMQQLDSVVGAPMEGSQSNAAVVAWASHWPIKIIIK